MMGARPGVHPGETDPADPGFREQEERVSKQSLPKGHPLARPIPADVSVFDLASSIVAARRGFSGPIGMSMKKDDDDPDDLEDPDGEEDPDPDLIDDPGAKVKIGDRTFEVSQLQKIMAREKRQGVRSGQKKLAEDLGFDSVEDLKAAIEAAGGKVDEPPAGGSDDAAVQEAARKAREREEAATRREAEAAEKARRAELRGILREHGVDKDDLDDVYVLLDRAVDKDYDEDDLEDAVEALKTRRPAFFDKDGSVEEPPARAARAAMPTGGRRRQPRQQQVFGAGGLDRAKRKGWVKTS
jgi:hypothetical protein